MTNVMIPPTKNGHGQEREHKTQSADTPTQQKGFWGNLWSKFKAYWTTAPDYPSAPVRVELPPVLAGGALDLGRELPQTTPQPTSMQVAAPPPIQGGRQTLPTNYSPFGLTTLGFIWRREYQSIDLSNIDISQYESGQLLLILADISPDVSRALWNILRVSGTDLTFRIKTLKRGTDDVAGQKLVDQLIKRLNPQAGGFPNLVTQLMISGFLQGALAMDIAPTEDLNDVEDFYPVNPNTIYFQRDENQVPVPFQMQALFWGQAFGVPGNVPGASAVGPFRRLNTELFQYIPIDPFVDDVYGRPPAAPTLQVIFFQIQVLRDLQRVLHRQGWPKVDIKVLTEILNRNVPSDIRNNPKRYSDFVRARMNEIATAYNSMAPEDAYIHPDYVEVSSDTVTAGTHLFDVKAMLQVVRSQVISGAKQLPVLMGEHLGETETYSEVELAIFAATVEVFRTPVGEALANALEIALQLMGHQAEAEPVWAPIKVRDSLRAAQTTQIDTANAAFERDQGWITQDEAAMLITGKKAVLPGPIPGSAVAPQPVEPATGDESGSTSAPAADPKDDDEGG